MYKFSYNTLSSQSYFGSRGYTRKGIPPPPRGGREKKQKKMMKKSLKRRGVELKVIKRFKKEWWFVS